MSKLYVNFYHVGKGVVFQRVSLTFRVAAQQSLLRTGSGASVKHDAHVIQRCTRRVGLLLRSVRVFRQFAWLEVGSVKVALSRPGRAPGWCPIPPTSTPQRL